MSGKEQLASFDAAQRGAAQSGTMQLGMMRLNPAQLDAHCHLQHDPRFRMYAQTHPEQHFFCMTETPDEYVRFRDAGLPANVSLGLGLHPWRVSADAAIAHAQVDGVLRLLSDAWLIGEVGLDFSPKHVRTRDNQLAAFRAIAQATARTPLSGSAQAACFAAGGVRVLSIHAVQAAGEALEILQEAGCFDACTCIFHWFSGTSDQLVAARRAGCYFSFGSRALATKRGRAYAAQLSADRVLRESDAFLLDEWLEDRRDAVPND
mgnify:CR=1 FL=1